VRAYTDTSQKKCRKDTATTTTTTTTYWRVFSFVGWKYTCKIVMMVINTRRSLSSSFPATATAMCSFFYSLSLSLSLSLSVNRYGLVKRPRTKPRVAARAVVNGLMPIESPAVFVVVFLLASFVFLSLTSINSTFTLHGLLKKSSAMC